jgi:hypothetical protein
MKFGSDAASAATQSAVRDARDRASQQVQTRPKPRRAPRKLEVR